MTHPTTTTGIRLAIIGPGALGTLFAARLALAGAPPLLLDYRQERAYALHREGIRLRDATGDQLVHVPVTADPQALGDIDAALILVKAYRTEEIAETLATHLPAHAVALTLQNGLGNVETLQLHLGHDRVFGGTAAQGALLETHGVVRDTGAGPITVGSPRGQADARLDDLCQALLLAGFAVSITCDLPAALWQKAILNAAINPVGALTRLRNGQLAAHSPSRKLMVAAAREAYAVAHALGIAVEAQDWAARLQTICQATAPNVNSMLQDVLLGRRTEIDAINGAVVRLAEQVKMPTPINHTLCCLVQAVEESYAEATPLT